MEEADTAERNRKEYDGYEYATDKEVIQAHGKQAVSLGTVVVSAKNSDKESQTDFAKSQVKDNRAKTKSAETSARV